MLFRKTLSKHLHKEKERLGRDLTLAEKRVVVIRAWDEVYYESTYPGRVLEAAKKAGIVPWNTSVHEGKTNTLPESPIVKPPGQTERLHDQRAVEGRIQEAKG